MIGMSMRGMLRWGRRGLEFWAVVLRRWLGYELCIMGLVTKAIDMKFEIEIPGRIEKWDKHRLCKVLF